MEKQYYTANSIEKVLRMLEREHGMSSDEFYAKAQADEVEGVPGFERALWVSLYLDYCRLREDDGFALAAERTLELV